MFFPRYLISSVSRLKRVPRHTSHSTKTSGRKCISIFLTPWPLHTSQRPPFTLNEKRPLLYPRALASLVCEKMLRISVNIPV